MILNKGNALKNSIHLSILLTFILILIWIFNYEDLGGVGFKDGRLFNWHVIFMFLGFGFFLAEGTIAWRVTAGLPHVVSKTVHGCLHLGMLICSILGLVAVVVFHNQIGAPNFYSVHSWLGITILTLAWTQLIAGIVTYWIPNLVSLSVKKMAMDYHRGFGKFLYIASVGVMLSGLMQKQSFVRKEYENEPFSAVLLVPNFIGLSLLLTAGLIMTTFDVLPPTKSEMSRITRRGSDENVVPSNRHGEEDFKLSERKASPYAPDVSTGSSSN